jgi:glycosyltransferase involved in cell wall biosynthesis
MKPPISVVLCTYNGAKYIEAQLASILAQTYAVA